MPGVENLIKNGKRQNGLLPQFSYHEAIPEISSHKVAGVHPLHLELSNSIAITVLPAALKDYT